VEWEQQTPTLRVFCFCEGWAAFFPATKSMPYFRNTVVLRRLGYSGLQFLLLL
jgi:hypothetical protein